MFCDRCKKNLATIHLTEIIKDDRSEAHLCEGCARDMGLNTKLSNFSLSVSDMLSFLDVNELNASDINIGDSGRICRACGNTFIDFKKSGRVGCQECYAWLSDSMTPVIASYHGERTHVGKIPRSGSAGSGPGNDDFSQPAGIDAMEGARGKDNLKERLERAVLEERYEDAARLRDMINE